MNDRFESYFAKRADLTQRALQAGSQEGIDQVVVIPVLAEQEYLFRTLDSLAQNPADDLRHTLVVCVVNNRAEPDAPRAMIDDNQQILAKLKAFPPDSPLRLGYVDASSPGCELPAKEGVGLARKIGMDWGLRVLSGSPASVRLLFSLDADTLVEPNYLAAVRGHFTQGASWAAVVAYAHPLEGRPPDEVAAIVCYELYLRYHVLGLHYAGSPYAYPAIGSTMICRAEAYAAVGGMNRRQGGEDFYFLQELLKTGGVDAIHATTVHPSGRSSERAPLGTGQRVLRFLRGDRDGYALYHPESYRILKEWLAVANADYDQSAEDLLAAADVIEPALAQFLSDQRFPEAWTRMRSHCRSGTQLERQFHRWFDGFRTLKLIHHLRDRGYPNQEMFKSIAALLHPRGEDAAAIAWPQLDDSVARQVQLLVLLRRLSVF